MTTFGSEPMRLLLERTWLDPFSTLEFVLDLVTQRSLTLSLSVSAHIKGDIKNVMNKGGEHPTAIVGRKEKKEPNSKCILFNTAGQVVPL